VQVVIVRSPTLTRSATSAQLVPDASLATCSTEPRNTIVSPGKIESCMRNVMRPRRPVGPVQSLT
jgi:hypothetical protein